MIKSNQTQQIQVVENLYNQHPNTQIENKVQTTNSNNSNNLPKTKIIF